MENSKNNSDNKSGASQEKNNNPATNPLNGFDFSKLLQNEGVMEFLKHLLSGGGAMAANYFLWIKPMQDKIEVMNKKIEENEREIKKQDERIEELEEEQEKLTKQLNLKEKEQEELHGANGEYFSIDKNKNFPMTKQRRYLD
ncbi:MAG: hypothetical protein HY062_19085 [Bacteroidetes bacterium]|nr:hypothetical protein [Bacteroidota bacterium]